MLVKSHKAFTTPQNLAKILAAFLALAEPRFFAIYALVFHYNPCIIRRLQGLKMPIRYYAVALILALIVVPSMARAPLMMNSVTASVER